MVELLRESKPKARKDHRCDASMVLIDELNNVHLTFSEWRAVVKAKQSGFKILKGQIYINQTCLYAGRIYCFKAIPAIHSICSKYDLYEE